ncbi:MAG: DUF5709 domain-containing protein [Propionibacteriaceae bacterium]|jgi:hypothetical protein|nr:DUF5709 domain-containing protein [Propionibacteriaceae bacterium]
MTDYAVEVPDESEQLDQLQPDVSLLHRGVDDVLDEGYVTPENWSPAQGFGNTKAEMRRGETLEQRVAQEQPEVVKDDTPWNPDPAEHREVGNKRAGRLVSAESGADGAGQDVGFAGGAASAEEAAMHIIDDYDDDDD